MYILKKIPDSLQTTRRKLSHSCQSAIQNNKLIPDATFGLYLGGSLAWQLINAQVNAIAVRPCDTDFYLSVSNPEHARIIRNSRKTIGSTLSKNYPQAIVTTVSHPATRECLFYQFKYKNIDCSIGAPVTYSNFNILIGPDNTVAYDPKISSHEQDFKDFIEKGIIISYNLQDLIIQAYASEHILNNLAYVLKSYDDPITHCNKTFEKETAKSLRDLFSLHPYIIIKITQRLKHYQERYPSDADATQYLKKLKQKVMQTLGDTTPDPDSVIAELKAHLTEARSSSEKDKANIDRLVSKISTANATIKAYQDASIEREKNLQKNEDKIRKLEEANSKLSQQNHSVQLALEQSFAQVAALKQDIASEKDKPKIQSREISTQTQPPTGPAAPKRRPIHYPRVTALFLSKLCKDNQFTTNIDAKFVKTAESAYKGMKANHDFQEASEELEQITSILCAITSLEESQYFIRVFNTLILTTQKHVLNKNDETDILFILLDHLRQISQTVSQQTKASSSSMIYSPENLDTLFAMVCYILESRYVTDISKVDPQVLDRLKNINMMLMSDTTIQPRLTNTLTGVQILVGFINRNARILLSCSNDGSPTIKVPKGFAKEYYKLHEQYGEHAANFALLTIEKSDATQRYIKYQTALAFHLKDAKKTDLKEKWAIHMAPYIEAHKHTRGGTYSDEYKTLAHKTMKNIINDIHAIMPEEIYESLLDVHFCMLLIYMRDKGFHLRHDDPLHMILSPLLTGQLHDTLSKLEHTDRIQAIAMAIHDAAQHHKSMGLFPIGPPDQFDKNIARELRKICDVYALFCNTTSNGFEAQVILNEITQALRVLVYREGTPEELAASQAPVIRQFSIIKKLTENEKEIIYKAYLFKISDKNKAMDFKEILSDYKPSLLQFYDSGELLKPFDDTVILALKNLLEAANKEALVNNLAYQNPELPNINHHENHRRILELLESSSDKTSLLKALHNLSKTEFFTKQFPSLQSTDFEKLFSAPHDTRLARPT